VSRPVVQIIVGSTRPGRIGRPVAEWVQRAAAAHGGVDAELVDLAEVALPMFDEPHHPRLGRYEHEHTKAWSATVARADAFVFVIPEYNHGYNAAIKNAIDYLALEWRHKPVGFVSYGGIAAGTRAVQQLKPVLAVLKMVPVPEAVHIPMVHGLLADGVIEPTDPMEAAAGVMFDEIVRWVDALAPLRTAD
jgi:NAD(P)H-dependent FMN reductase